MIYMHKQITKTIYAGSAVLVDHINGHQLDNRRQNLAKGGHSDNGRNILFEAYKKCNFHLPVGVKPVSYVLRKSGEKIISGYRGRIRIRGKDVLSKTVFKDPQKAARWHSRMKKKIHPDRRGWKGCTDAPLPEFPPLWAPKDVSFEVGNETIPF
jgi:hypothetical protein